MRASALRPSVASDARARGAMQEIHVRSLAQRRREELPSHDRRRRRSCEPSSASKMHGEGARRRAVLHGPHPARGPLRPVPAAGARGPAGPRSLLDALAGDRRGGPAREAAEVHNEGEKDAPADEAATDAAPAAEVLVHVAVVPAAEAAPETSAKRRYRGLVERGDGRAGGRRGGRRRHGRLPRGARPRRGAARRRDVRGRAARRASSDEAPPPRTTRLLRRRSGGDRDHARRRRGGRDRGPAPEATPRRTPPAMGPGCRCSRGVDANGSAAAGTGAQPASSACPAARSRRRDASSLQARAPFVDPDKGVHTESEASPARCGSSRTVSVGMRGCAGHVAPRRRQGRRHARPRERGREEGGAAQEPAQAGGAAAPAPGTS